MKSSPTPTPRPADRLPRDRRIDLCYVIGILLVVAGHSGVDSRFASTALFRWIYAFHMPLFFALSGYLFRYGGGSGQVGAGTFARRRALRLLLPLVVWTTLVFIPKGLLSAYAMRPSELSFSAYLHAFLYPADNPIRPFWFLEVLFEVSLAGYAVDRIVRSRPAALAAVAGTCIAANRLIAPTGGELLMLPDVLWYTGFFLLGAVACDGRTWLWPRLARPSSLVFWGAASLVTLRCPSPRVRRGPSTAGCACRSRTICAGIPLRSTCSTCCLSASCAACSIPVWRSIPPSFRRCSSCRASSFPGPWDAWRGGGYPPSRREAVCRSACWVYRIQRLSR